MSFEFGYYESGSDESLTDIENNSYVDTDTIVALATPAGFGGVAVIRVSGSSQSVLTIAEKILRKSKASIKPRYAYYGGFYNQELSKPTTKSPPASNGYSNTLIDKGIAIYFSGPNSYTGENILELHCHGGPLIVDRLISTIRGMHGFDIRLAEPGEFTKRAWLNGKMDLAQVEAVADIISATSKQAAQCAVNTLDGEFSKLIKNFLGKLVELRTFVEATIDFSDQDIDFIKDGDVVNKLNILQNQINSTFDSAEQGVLLHEGVDIAIAGEPNVGKSSLLNALCRKEQAIVTAIPGTTRDVIKTNLNIKGVPVTLTDTAGLRETSDVVEKEGIRRAYQNIDKSDLVLLVIDCSINDSQQLLVYKELLDKYLDKTIIVLNKLDKLEISEQHCDSLKCFNEVEIINKKLWNNCQSLDVNKIANVETAYISAKDSTGIEALEKYILNKIGYKQTTEGKFIARRRHLDSLNKVKLCLVAAQELLKMDSLQDLIAEELRKAQVHLGEITGEYTPDDLLGSIFSSFCIGK